MQFTLPKLSYDFAALEPHIDALTMNIHYSKHHQTYINNLNAALALESNFTSIENILSNVSKYSPVIRNNGGGHYNHTFFWEILSPPHASRPEGELYSAIQDTFVSFDKFKETFTKVALERFGSGWAWLYLNNKGSLSICSTPNQDNPLMDTVPIHERGVPILGIDLWEHAYYLKYQNFRSKYVDAFWNVINWNIVGQKYYDAHVGGSV